MFRALFTAILLVLSCLAVAGHANAEDLTDLSIEELLNVEVITASRLGQKANLSPSSVSVLTAADIRTFGWRTLADALNALRGINTSTERNYSYVGVRGFLHPNDFNSRVLFMIDGQRMNENIFDGGYMGQEFMLDIDLIERIEYIPGSGSSIYGANAFLGLINVVTKTGQGLNGLQLASSAASYNTYQGRASFGKKLANGLDVLVSGSHYDSAGVSNLYFPEFDSPATNNGIAHNRDGEWATRLFARLQSENFTAMAGLVDRKKQVPTASFDGIFNDPVFFTRDQQYFGNLKYTHTFSPQTALQLKGFFHGYEYSSDEAYINHNRRVIDRDGASSRWWGGDAQLTTTLLDRHRLLLGVEYQYDQRQYMYNYDLNPYEFHQGSQRSGNRVELYAQDDIQLFDTLIFSAGLRLDYHHMLKSLQLNPRLGLIWNPLDSTSFKLLYSSTFRAPNVWERDYNYTPIATNPNNVEERIKSYEGVWEWHSNTGIKLTTDLFYNDMTQILEQKQEPGYGASGAFYNIGNYHALGFEWEAEKRWDNGRLAKLSYTYTRVTDESNGGMRAVASPEHLLKFHYAEPLWNGFARLGLENIYIGDR
ncbi:MAG: TonB-dependent receptor, partial [Methylococcaceae bacterium]|nr:TonB-dependent receptor [Methylococcaceae bacterium]